MIQSKKNIEQHFPLDLRFIMLYKVALTFELANKILTMGGHGNKRLLCQ